MKNKKYYLVTGGCGFIGSHLVDALIENGHDVLILDNLSTGRKENINPAASLLIGDTTNPDTVEHALIGTDGCFHLAAVASVEKSITEWANTHTINATSTVNIFQAASRHNPKIPVVYTSSAAVYGNCDTFPISEATSPAPLTAYGADKYSCDLHGKVAWHVHNVPNIGLRPFNIYGPRQDPYSPYSGVISIFTNRIIKGLPITVYGDGRQIRDFVYVEDAVKAFTTAMQKLHHAPANIGHDIINICTGRPTLINQLAELIEKITACKMNRSHAAARNGDIRVSIGDPSKLFLRLGLKLNVTLEEGLCALLNKQPATTPFKTALHVN